MTPKEILSKVDEHNGTARCLALITNNFDEFVEMLREQDAARENRDNPVTVAALRGSLDSALESLNVSTAKADDLNDELLAARERIKSLESIAELYKAGMIKSSEDNRQLKKDIVSLEEAIAYRDGIIGKRIVQFRLEEEKDQR